MALPDQLRDLLLHPQLPRTPVGNLNRRGRSKGAENPNGTAWPQQFFNWAVLELVTRHSQPSNCCNRSVGIALPIHCHGGGKGKGKTHPPSPTSKNSWREKKRRGIQASSPEFFSQGRERGRWIGTRIAVKHPVAPRILWLAQQ